jgi:hypothetical protein
VASARSSNGEHWHGIEEHGLPGAVRQDKRRAQGPSDRESQPPLSGITELYVRQITQTAIVLYGIRRCQSNSDTRNLVAVHALPPKSLPLCERSTKVKLLPCESMTRPLKDSQAFGACQWHDFTRMPTMTPSCQHRTWDKVKSHYHD